MTRITAVIMQKGGTAKTTTAQHLAAGLKLRGYNVLSIDADPQGNLTDTMQANGDTGSLYDVLRGDMSAADAIQTTAQGDVIASSLFLASADMEFTQTGREYRLREALESIGGRYDHVVIDCPPALGIMTVNALTAATDIIIPIGADVYSIQGLAQLLQTVDSVRRYSNRGLQIAGLLITRKGSRATLTAQLSAAISDRAQALGLHLYGASIREAVAVREAQALQTTLYEHAPRGRVTADYIAFVDEYLTQEG